MFGMNITALDWAAFVLAIIITVYILAAKNPYPKDSNEYQSLRLCRIGLALLAWAFGFGLIGFAFALVAFILGIIGIVKGRTAYGIFLIVGSVVVPVLSLLNTFSGKAL